MSQNSALVLFSGGQDSTVCLAWALKRYSHIETVGFSYGQRHAIELETRTRLLHKLKDAFPDWATKLGEDFELDLPTLGRISETSLTRQSEITIGEAGLPNTFVPGRNLLFFTYASALAWRRSIPTLVGGMCETDYSGYPDCRNDTLQTLAKALSLGLDKPVIIETPLMYVDKAATWQLASDLGGERLVDLIIEDTHTCYLGTRDKFFDWGYGCGTCPACELRATGWQKWQTTKKSAQL